MKLLIALIALTLSLTANAECFDVAGIVKTQTLNEFQQAGFIRLDLTSRSSDRYFQLFGKLGGTITEANEDGSLFISHAAVSADTEQAWSFITHNDKAVITGQPDGCNIPVSENISKIVGGSGITKDVTVVDITVNGTIAAPGCKGVLNVFKDVTGVMCLNHEEAE